MTPRDLLADLRRRGVVLWIDGDRLRYSAPTGVVGPDRLALLREHKAALIARLAAEAAADPDAVRLGAATALFDGEPWPDEAAEIARIACMPGLVRCFACNFERNAEIVVCPVCHPAARLPTGCLARTMCSGPEVGPCERHAAGRPCLVAIPNGGDDA